jgi:hypothetical protein
MQFSLTGSAVMKQKDENFRNFFRLNNSYGILRMKVVFAKDVHDLCPDLIACIYSYLI